MADIAINSSPPRDIIGGPSSKMNNCHDDDDHHQQQQPDFSVHYDEKETSCEIGPIRIRSAVASFVYKGEDRFDLWRCTNHKNLDKLCHNNNNNNTRNKNQSSSSDDDASSRVSSASASSSTYSGSRGYCGAYLTSSPTARARMLRRKRSSSSFSKHSSGRSRPKSDGPQLLAFGAVFDGHDGSAASEYCANNGLLSHILLETAKKNGNNKDQKNKDTTWLNLKDSVQNSDGSRATASWSPIQDALEDVEACCTPFEAAHARAFCEAQLQFEAGCAPLSVKQATKQIMDMHKNKLSPQDHLQPPQHRNHHHRLGGIVQRDHSGLLKKFGCLRSPSRPGLHRSNSSAGLLKMGSGEANHRRIGLARANSGLMRGFLRRRHSSEELRPDVHGGTTACTLSIYCQPSELERYDEFDHSDHSDQDQSSFSVFAVVASCGDSRLITDGGTGGSCYTVITRDHRPSDPDEGERLTRCSQRGFGSVAVPRWIPTTGSGSDAWIHSPVERLFPGGLAVSRTIGDTSCSQAAVPVPDVYRLPLEREHVAPNHASVSATALSTPSLNRRAVWSSKKFNADSRRSVATASTVESAGSAGTNPATAGPDKAATPHTFRFVLATDGLWDMLSSEQVGLLAARTAAGSGAEEIPAHVSATRIMQECLACCQERRLYDDITILVLDVAIL